MATASDVAKLAGVSQSTVSYVMSGARSISPETRARVEAAMKELSYHPNAGARALAGRRTNVVGLVASLSADTDVAELLPFIETISSYCREHDYDVVLVTEDEGPAGLQRLAGRAIVDAIVLMDIRRQDDRAEVARNLNVPVVLIGIPDDATGLDCVDYGVEAAARLAVEELVETGSRRLILIGENPTVRAKEFGFIGQFAQSARRAAVTRGVSFEEYTPTADGWAGFAHFDELAPSLAGQSVGIVTRTPQAADITMQILHTHGLTPGRDVAVVGLSTDSAAQAFRFPLSNVSPEPKAVSAYAIARIFNRLAGAEPSPAVHLITPRLTRRATSGN